MGLENCCRLCLKDLSDARLDGEEYLQIAQHRDLQYMVLDCFEIVISDDEIVTKVCSDCNEAVRYVTQIRKKVKSADEEIKKFYTEVKVKEEVDTLDEPERKSENFEELIVESKDALALFEFETEPKIEVMEEDVDSEGGNFINLKDKDKAEEEVYESEEVSDEDDTILDKSYELSPIKVKQKRKPKKRLIKDETFDFRCYICSTDFTSTAELNTHLHTHVGSNPKVCHICDEVVKTVRNYNYHLRRRHFRIRKAIPCDECSKIGIVREYSSNQVLQAHIKSVHEGIVDVEKDYVCTYCGKKFAKAYQLKKHENCHTKERVYKCDRCGLALASRSSLIRHERIHTNEKPYKCDECDSAFNQPSALKQHKAYRHTDERPFSCEICGDSVRFKNMNYLRKHMLIHGKSEQGKSRVLKKIGSKERMVAQPDLKCDFCPALYHKERYLCKHILDKHPSENVPMIQCELCKADNKTIYFLTQAEADDHTEYHGRMIKVPDREHKCGDCGQMFKTSVLLYHHRVRTHISNKCSQCGKNFTTPNNLKRHVLIVHLKERPYNCDQCDSAFGQMTQLTNHVKKMHNGA